MQVSFWENNSFYAERDIVIVGAGLAGLWSAYELYKRQPGIKILLLERSPIPCGASTRNAGFACFGSPTELLADFQLQGEDAMWLVAEMRYKGLEKTRALFGANDIDWDSCGGFELLNQGYVGLSTLPENLAWLNKGLQKITGQPETFVRRDEKLGQFNFKGFAALVENTLEAGIHSGKLVQALTQKVLSLGINILYGTAVAAWQSHDNGATVVTASDLTLKTGKLLFCTNAFTSSLATNLPVTPARGQILLTAPIESLPFRGTFHYDEGFYYFRNIGNRVLIGGARNMAVAQETTTNMETTENIQTELERFLSTNILAGQPFVVEQRWSGIMGFTENKQPVAKQIAHNTYALVTCNGMGVALAPMMAEKAAELVLG